MKRERGILLIEVLVSMLIASIALLGTVMMMARSTRNEMESYQRVQALTLPHAGAVRGSSARRALPWLPRADASARRR